MTLPRGRKQGSRRRSSALDDAVSYLGRAYFSYLGLLERLLQELQLDQYLAPGMSQILLALFEHEDCIIKDIADRVCLSQSTLTGILTKMERTGLIERRRDDQDGRAQRVRLSPLGRALEPKCSELVERVAKRLKHSISDDELDDLRAGLVKLTEALRPEPKPLVKGT